MATEISTWLKFAIQQMAAESYMNGINLQDPTAVIRRLIDGNNNSQVIPSDLFTGMTRFVNMAGVPTASQITGSAQAFVSRYEILDHHANDATGFSATLMRDIQTGEYTLSFRSLEYQNQVDGGDWERDGQGGAAGEIAGAGFALGQLVSMERYYEELKNSGKLPAGATLNVTGYSLGGHLATVFTELHSNEINHTYIFNGAGIGQVGGITPVLTEEIRIKQLIDAMDAKFVEFDPTGNFTRSGATANVQTLSWYQPAVAQVAGQFQTTGTASLPTGGLTGGMTRTDGAFQKITQFFGTSVTGGDVQLVANSGMHGPVQPVLIEGQPLIESIPVLQESVYGNAHSLTLIVDSLALQELFETADPDLTQADIESIFKAASTARADVVALPVEEHTAEGDTLEQALDALRKLFLPTDPDPKTDFNDDTGGFGDLGTRNEFYTHLEQVRIALNNQTYSIEPLVQANSQGSVGSRLTASELKTAAQDPGTRGLAYRYALRALNPFAVVGVDYEGLGHTANGQLALYDSTTGVGEMTDQYLDDRGAFLLAHLGLTLANIPAPLSPSLTHYRDVASGIEVSATLPNFQREYLFGSSDAETLEGHELTNDHLYGGDGVDTLVGYGGNDYLQGDEGNDTLDGGSGADRMVGGRGHDAYIVDDLGDQVIEGLNDGSDTVQSSVTFTLGANVEDLTLTGSGNINGAGNELDNLILGNSGVNRLEGRDGTDHLIGGEKNDMLLGGAGDNDLLEGGAGFDTYIYHAGDGADRIEDSDAQGQIIFDGRLLQGGIRLADDAPNTYTSLDGGTTYVMSNTDLIVNGVLTVNENFQSGQMGIVLQDEPSYANGLETRTNADYPGTFNDLNNGVFLSGPYNYVVHGLGGNDSIFTSIDADGNDQIFGDAGDDRLQGDGGHDQLFGGDGADVLFGQSGDDRLDGDAGDDRLLGGYGVDVERGGDGDDLMMGDFGLDVDDPLPFDLARGAGDFMDGGNGNDKMEGETGSDLLAGGTGDDELWGDFGLFNPGNVDWSTTALLQQEGNDSLDGGDGNDILIGGAGADILSGGAGNDRLDGDLPYDVTTLPFGARQTVGSNDVLDGGAGSDFLQGGVGDDELFGGQGSDTLYGEDYLSLSNPGNDFLDGEEGDDFLAGGRGDDVLVGGSGNDQLVGEDAQNANDGGDDLLLGEDGDDELYGGAGQDQLVGGAGADILMGDDLVVLNFFGVPVYTASQAPTDDQLDGGEGDDRLYGNGGNDILTGGGGNDFLSGDDYIDGLTAQYASPGQDILDGEDGDDQLVGGAGDDQLFGGTGNDQLIGDRIGRPEFLDQGGNDFLDGGDGDDVVDGGLGDDVLSGGSGNDALFGGAGNDTYHFNLGDGVDSIGDSAASGEPNRLVIGADIDPASLKLRVENGQLRLPIGTNGDIVLLGASLEDVLGDHAVDRFQFSDGTVLTFDELVARGIDVPGTNAEDQLFGTNLGDRILSGAGNDVLDGGRGDDTYLFNVGDGHDLIQDQSLPGEENSVAFGVGITADQLQLSLVPDGSDPNASDLLIGLGVGDAVQLDQFDRDDVFGQETIDTFRFADGTTLSYTQLLTRGFDLEGTAADDTLQGTNVTDRLMSQEGHDVLIAGLGDDLLDGGSGDDRLQGGKGNDIYLFGIGSGHDTIAETQGDMDTIRFAPGIRSSDVTVARNGRDLVLAVAGGVDQLTVSNYFLSPMFQVERIEFAEGTAWDHVAILSLAQNMVIGSAGADTLVGTSSKDVLVGLGGNDQLTGLAGDDVLDGGMGADTLRGGEGNDVYVVDDAGDVVIEVANEGTDTVRSSVTVTLSSHIEHLTVTGAAALNGRGNALDNVLVGNSGVNVLTGGAGNDTYVIGTGDTVVEEAGEGIDTVLTDQTYTLGANVENLTLTGVGAVTGTGNELANVLTGNGSADVLAGGAGNDTYIVDGLESIHEARGEGVDTVLSSRSYRLGPNLENLTLVDTEFAHLWAPYDVPLLEATGNELNNVLIGTRGQNVLDGSEGSDTLDGREGNDTLIGGIGVDTYLFGRGAGSDVIIDAHNGETDVIHIADDARPVDVHVSRDYSGNLILYLEASPDQLMLPDFFQSAENRLKEVRFHDGTVWDATELLARAVASPTIGAIMLGTQSNDTLTGEGNHDTLSGFFGNDMLIGGAGNDRLYGLFDGGPLLGMPISTDDDLLQGGDGDDLLYGGIGSDVLDGGRGSDVLVGGAGHDTFLFTRGWGQDTIAYYDFPRLVDNDLDALDIIKMGLDIAPSDVIVSRNGIGLTLSLSGTADQVAISPSFMSGTFLIDAVQFEDGTRWDLPTLQVMAQDAGIVGTSVSDVLSDGFSSTADVFQGLGGDDVLDSWDGQDILIGGPGNDTYVIEGTQRTVMILEAAGEGRDAVQASENYVLPENVEDLELKGLAFTGTGNALNNRVTGTDQDNTLDGGEGNDTLIGGYVREMEGGIAFGDTGSDILIGGNGNDVLIPVGGIIDEFGAIHPTGDHPVVTPDDLLIGGQGDDLYILHHAGETVIEAADEGTDTVWISVSYILPANVENLSLITGGVEIDTNGTGNDFNNLLIGSKSANVLSGLDGDDTLMGGWDAYTSEPFMERSVDDRMTDLLIGGRGDDTYVMLGTSFRTGLPDTILELFDEGTDMVSSHITYALGDNVENLTLQGDQAIDGTGNALDNDIVGNAANNTLAGGTAVDRLSGRSGDDTYLFNLGDGIDTVEDIAALGEGNRILFSADIVLTDLTFVQDQLARKMTIQVGVSGTDRIILTNFDPSGVNGSLVVETLAFADGSTVNLVDLLGGGPITGSTGDDVLTGTAGDDVINAQAGNDTITGLDGADTIDGGVGNDLLDGGAGADTLVGGLGDDTYVIDDAGDVVTESLNEGIDTVQSGLSYMLGDNLEDLTLTGTANLTGMGNALSNRLTGNSGNNVLDGQAGADTMEGGAGNDTYLVDNAVDVVMELGNEGIDLVQSSLTYALEANVDNLALTGTGAINGTGNELDNVLTGNSAANILTGGTGNDIYIVSTGDTVIEAANQGLDRVVSDSTWILGANLEHLTLTGTAAINGTGNTLSNVLTGNSANNQLNGGAGADTLAGGLGNDIYIVDNMGDVVTEQANEGTDTVRASINYGLGANVENLTLTGAGAIAGTGNSLNNTLTGNSAANILTGGAGDDLYLVGAGDSVVEQLNEGIDTVQSAITWTIGANVENLTLTGAAAINGTGNDLNNVLTGNSAVNMLDGDAGDDTLSGGAGADMLVGGLGNDTYVVENVGDVITEQLNEGTDTIQSSVSYTLSVNAENLTLTGTGALSATGNTGDNVLTGNSGNNVLDGGAGADTLVGGLGNDTYVVDNMGDVISENLSEGTDTVQASITYALGANVENLTLVGSGVINGTGNSANNVLAGNSAANVLDGGGGTDTLRGGLGDDSYVIDDATDVVTEALNEGIDTVQTDFTYTLGANVENLTSTGTGAINGTGNTLNNVLTGNSATNTLNGGAGADTLIGGQGDDTYLVDNVGDVVTEQADEGTDLVQSSVSYSLSADVENLTLIGSATINATGNSLNNILTGNAGANVLDGGTGVDTLLGGKGNDTYLVDDVGDVVTENFNEGIDTVQASISYTLGLNLENLALTGTATIDGTGNALNNVLTGNSAANTLSGGDGNDTLDGGSGADSLVGGLGNDTYVIDDANDLVTEALNEGTDTVQSSVTYTLSSNVENLILIGASAINGTGNALNNVLTGNSAANIQTGGTGNDTYVVGAGDSVIEQANEGTDTVQSDVSWTLSANLENLTLLGSTVIDGIGNTLNNVLRGNSAANVLAGGTSNDTYVVSTGDTIVENANEGTDTVQSDVTWTLGVNLENLTLIGSVATNATGNGAANVLIGNTAANQLIGGTGNDMLRGGLGNDTYLIARGDGQDVISENDGTVGNNDTLLYDATINPLDLVLSRQVNDLRLSIHGGADTVMIQNWFTAPTTAQVETIQAGNGQTLLNAQVDQLIQAMATFSQQTGLTWDQAIDQRPQEVQTVLAANWH